MARLARETAMDAGRFLRARRTRIRSIRNKEGQGNLVTDMDRRAEDRIVRRLLRAFPDHEIFAEESQPTRTGSPYRWHIDPLDGTTNYAHGFPFYCVSIGLEVRGRIEMGVVYDPSHDDLFEAARGRGARRNGRPIRASATKRLEDAVLVTGFSYHVPKKLENLRYFNRFMDITRAIRRVGSAALDLCYTAAGVFDGFWEFSLGAWDVAAAGLICSEAGVTVTNFAGGPFDLYEGEILAANPALHPTMRRVLAEVRAARPSPRRSGSPK